MQDMILTGYAAIIHLWPSADHKPYGRQVSINTIRKRADCNYFKRWQVTVRWLESIATTTFAIWN